jgi:hypothetical protein
MTSSSSLQFNFFLSKVESECRFSNPIVEELSLYSGQEKPCIPCPSEVKGKGIRRMREVADKEAYSIHTINIISQQQYFVARCLSSSVSNVFGLHRICFVFLLLAN